MGILSSNQYVSDNRINCGGELTATLSLSAVSYSVNIPLEIAIVVDGKSAQLEQAKAAALDLIEALQEKYGGGTEFSGAVKAAVIGFGRDIPVSTELTNSVEMLEEAVNSVPESEESNISLAISYAANILLNSARATNSMKFMFLFTDGDANYGDDPLLAAQTARAGGINLYIVALDGTRDYTLNEMLSWASVPSSAFLLKNYGSDGSYDNFILNFGENNFYKAPSDIVLTAVVDDNFVINCVSSATKGVASIIDNRTVQWKIDSMASDNTVEGAELNFLVKHTGSETGMFSLEKSITFTDADDSGALISNPGIIVNCGNIVVVDDCPEPVETSTVNCGEVITIEAGDITTELMGRFAEISATISNVCPGRRVALAAVLTEVDDDGFEHPRGMRTITIPAHNYPECHDIRVEALKIVVPGDIDDIDVLPCEERNFRTRLYVNYIDSGYICGEI